MIELKNVKKQYDDNVVFENLNINFENKQITAIMGESGCGKTTLLNMLAGLTDFDGTIKKDYDNVSFVFNDNRLIPNLTVEQNLKIVNNNIDLSPFLKFAEIENVRNYYPKQLSSGMAHRVSLLRAFIYPSDLLLMDEPFRNLDVVLKLKLINLFKNLWEKDKKTVIFVSHSIEDVLNIADNVVIIKNKKIALSEKCKQKNIKKLITNCLTKE